MVPHADDDRPIEGGVGLAVTAPVEAVPPSGPPGRGGDGTRATELRGRGLRANPLGVVAEDNQEQIFDRLLGRAREVLEVEVPAIPSTSDADLAASLTALLHRLHPVNG